MPPRPKAKNETGPGTTASASPVSTARATPASSSAAAMTNYGEIQQNEIEALRSIYMDDFKDVEKKPAAWNRTPDHAFNLLLKAPSNEAFHVLLSVELPATYPKTLPTLKVTRSGELMPSAATKITRIIIDVPKSLLGQEMIFDISSQITDVLDETAQSHADNEALPSLEEERKLQAATFEQDAQQAERLRQEQDRATMVRFESDYKEILEQEEKEREERDLRHACLDGENLDQLVTSTPRTLGNASYTGYDDGIVEFDQIMKGRNVNGDEFFNFRRVCRPDVLTDQPYETVAGVFPVTKSTIRPFKVCLTQVKVRDKSIAQSLDQTRKLEQCLEDVKQCDHINIVKMLNFKFTLLGTEPHTSFIVDILSEWANHGNFSELLRTTGPLRPALAREYLSQILDGLEYYDQKGIVHPGLSASKVLCFYSRAGLLQLKVADGYGSALSTLPFSDEPPELPYWCPPEIMQKDGRRIAETSIFELGVILVQMALGYNVQKRYTSPNDMYENAILYPLFEKQVDVMLQRNPIHRPRAWDIICGIFIRSSEPLAERDESEEKKKDKDNMEGHSDEDSEKGAPLTPIPTRPRVRRESSKRIRRESSHIIGRTGRARYAHEYNELGRLGKGGFGEVVKARNKLDHQVYAIKKIVSDTASDFHEIMPEIILLGRINSAHVVRYFSAWIEYEDRVLEREEETTSSAQSAPTDDQPEFDFPSSRHDFMSSEGIEFGFDSDDESPEGGMPAITSSGSSSGNVPKLGAMPTRQERLNKSVIPRMSTLYIQMELCEKSTLRDLIRQGLLEKVDDCWRLFRQIVEGLVHIHTIGVIHRDLKPENIFMDSTNTARIGDFGLATSAVFSSITGSRGRYLNVGASSTSIGTPAYTAPELSRNGGGKYTSKIDMYSLGIIFFEMCFPFKTYHERIKQLNKIREHEHVLPAVFNKPEKKMQGEIILRLIDHNPAHRPYASELAESDDLPLSQEDESLNKIFAALANPDSIEYKKTLRAQFRQDPTKLQDHLWDRFSREDVTAQHLLTSQMARVTLTSIFERHGSLNLDTEEVFPASTHYDSAVKILDTSGIVLQLQYDLTLSNARLLARRDHGFTKTFSFGNVYRQTESGARPRQVDEVDFDIMSRSTSDFAIQEAEVIKVMDEVTFAFPPLRSLMWQIHFNHADLLELILEYCSIKKEHWSLIKVQLSRLNLQGNGWNKIKTEFRDAKFNIASTALDQLSRFDFQGPLEETRELIEGIFTNTEFAAKLPQIFGRLSAVLTCVKRFDVKRPILHNPLACYNEHLYQGSTLFQLVTENKSRKIWAVGGRYDKLIEEFMVQRASEQPRAVGFHLNLEELYRQLRKAQDAKAGEKRSSRTVAKDDVNALKPRRCDVLVTSFDPEIRESTGVETVQELWRNGISADLSAAFTSMEELNVKHKEDTHSWVLQIRHDANAVGARGIKIRSVSKKEDVDVAQGDVINYLRNEIRVRDGALADMPVSRSIPLTRQDSAVLVEREIQVLAPQHRGKKTNRRAIIDSAAARAREVAETTAHEAPIAAVETSDNLLEALRDTRMGDAESWRAFVQSAPLAERQYLQQLHDMLKEWAAAGHRGAFVFNYRTKACILYDLGRSA